MAKKFLTSITISASSGGEYTFPIADGTANQAIITDGNGNLSFGSAIASSAEDAQRLVCEMINASGSTIGAFLPVCCVGMHSDGTPEIAPARADNALYMPAIGVTQASVGNNNRTDVLLYGKIENVNTTAYQTGDTLYVAPTGGWTTTRPTGTNYIQAVLKVGRVHANNGSGGAFGAGKYEDLPNLGTGKIWVGDSSSYPVATSIATAVTAAYGYTPADDSAVVHIAGTETITGAKTFSSTITASSTISINGGVLAGNNIVSMRANAGGGQFRIEKSDGSLSAYPFYIGSDGTALAYYYNASGALKVLLHTNGTSYFGNNLSVGYSTYSATSFALDVNGTANIVNALTAGSFVKSGGVAAEILAADGSVITAGTGIAISGGTIAATGGASSSARTEQTFTATTGSNTLTVTGGYTVGLIDVYVNGVKYAPSDFTATTSPTVVINNLVANDIISIISYTSSITALPTSRDVFDYTATAGQVDFTVAGGYTIGLLDVYVNGTKLTSSEYTMPDTTKFTLTFASVAGNQVQAIRYNSSITGISGSGTTNYVPKFTATGTIGNSAITDDGTTVALVSRALSGTSATFSSTIKASGGGAGSVNSVAIRVDNNKFQSFYNAADTGWAFSLGTNTSNDGILLANNNMTFGTGSSATERMRITSGGYTKASNTGSYYSIGAGYHEFNQSVADASVRVINSNASPYGVSVYFTGADPNNASNYIFNATSTSSGTSLYSIWSNGTVSGRSDVRLKKNIVDSTPKLDKLMQLRVVNYEWKESLEGTKELGLIAQEVEEVFPNLVITEPVIKEREVVLEDGTVENEKYEDGDYKSLKNSVLPYITIKALQELTAQVQELSTKLDEANTRLQLLENK